MARQLEGTVDQGRLDAERRAQASQTTLAGQRGQAIRLLPDAQRARLLEAIAQHLGLADGDGNVR